MLQSINLLDESESPIPPPPSITLRVDFTTEEGGDDAINKGEQYKILATLTDIIIQLVTRVNDIDSTTLDLVKFYAKDDTEGKYANSDSKRGKLYQAFINKNLSKLPGDWKMSTSDEVIMLSPVINEAIVGDKIECDNCGWSWKIVDGGDDLFICHKCDHDNTPIDEGFNKKLGKDPFGLEQFARELMTEGAYDSLVTQLTKATIINGLKIQRKNRCPKNHLLILILTMLMVKVENLNLTMLVWLNLIKK